MNASNASADLVRIQSGRITALEDEVERLRNQCEMWADACAMVEMNRDQLRAERDALRAVYEAASGLCMGMDWNHGTHAGKYKVELIHAVKVAEAAIAARGEDE